MSNILAEIKPNWFLRDSNKFDGAGLQWVLTYKTHIHLRICTPKACTNTLYVMMATVKDDSKSLPREPNTVRLWKACEATQEYLKEPRSIKYDRNNIRYVYISTIPPLSDAEKQTLNLEKFGKLLEVYIGFWEQNSSLDSQNTEIEW